MQDIPSIRHYKKKVYDTSGILQYVLLRKLPICPACLQQWRGIGNSNFCPVLETLDGALCRQEQDRAHTAKKRASEPYEDYSQSNRIAMTNKRSENVSVECAISVLKSGLAQISCVRIVTA